MQTQYLTPDYLASVQKGDVQQITAQVNDAHGTPGQMLEITDGTITIDYTAATRRTCTLTITDPTRVLVPAIASDTIAPYGQSLTVFFGPINNPVQMGIFYIQEDDADDQGTQFEFTVKGYDRSGIISQEALTAVQTIAAGTNYAAAIQALLASRDPSLKFNFAPTSYVTPLITLDINQDPWAAALQMATAIGMDLFFDRGGTCVMRPTPDPANVAQSWIYSDSDMGYGFMLDELQKNVVADGTVYNHVIVTAETSSTTDTYQAEAMDTNPASPTYVNGPFRDRPIFYKSSIVTSTAQAQALANAKLVYYLGRSDQVTLIGPPNPAQDEEDVVRISRSALSLNSLYTIDKLQFAISPAGENTTQAGGSSGSSGTGTQTLTCRGVIPGL